MNLETFQKQALRFWKPSGNLMHDHLECRIGRLGEFGEVLGEIKKVEIYGKPFDEVREALVLELGDMLWYVVLQAKVFKQSLNFAEFRSTGHSRCDRLNWAMGRAYDLSPEAGYQVVQCIAKEYGISLVEVMAKNIKKLEDRHGSTKHL